MTEWKNPYKNSDRDTLRQIAIMIGCLGSAIFCFFGIWIGLGSAYGDWTPSFDRVIFAIIIAAIPFMLPLTMNLIAIPLLSRVEHRPAGLALLSAACIFALVIGIVAVQLGKF